jgi:hypothetical protein
MFEAGDVLVFQLESGYGLMKVLSRSDEDERIWHLRVYSDLFLDTDSAENAAASLDSLSVSIPHVALTNRAFESTPVSRLINTPVRDEELSTLSDWRESQRPHVSDRSIRLLIGLR